MIFDSFTLLRVGQLKYLIIILLTLASITGYGLLNAILSIADAEYSLDQIVMVMLTIHWTYLTSVADYSFDQFQFVITLMTLCRNSLS